MYFIDLELESLINEPTTKGSKEQAEDVENHTIVSRQASSMQDVSLHPGVYHVNETFSNSHFAPQDGKSMHMNGKASNLYHWKTAFERDAYYLKGHLSHNGKQVLVITKYWVEIEGRETPCTLVITERKDQKPTACSKRKRQEQPQQQSE